MGEIYAFKLENKFDLHLTIQDTGSAYINIITITNSLCSIKRAAHNLRHLISVLTWAFYFIATHPDVEQKVYEEIKAVLGEEDESYASMRDLV